MLRCKRCTFRISYCIDGPITYPLPVVVHRLGLLVFLLEILSRVETLSAKMLQRALEGGLGSTYTPSSNAFDHHPQYIFQ